MPIKELPPITFPHSFSAGNTFRVGISALTAVALFYAGVTISHHKTLDAGIEVALSLGFLFILLLIFSLRIRVDDVGVTQSWLIGKTSLPWSHLSRIDRTRQSYSLHIADGSMPVLLSLLSTPAQTAVAQEAIRCAGLKPSRGKLDYPTVEQWTR